MHPSYASKLANLLLKFGMFYRRDPIHARGTGQCAGQIFYAHLEISRNTVWRLRKCVAWRLVLVNDTLCGRSDGGRVMWDMCMCRMLREEVLAA